MNTHNPSGPPAASSTPETPITMKPDHEGQRQPHSRVSTMPFDVEIRTGNRAQDRARGEVEASTGAGVSAGAVSSAGAPSPLALQRRERLERRRRIVRVTGITLALLLIVWGTAASWQPLLEGNVVARVNGVPITNEQVAREIRVSKALAVAASGKEQAPAPPSMLEQMIVVELKAQAARRANFSVTSQDVDREISTIIQRAKTTQDKLGVALRSYGLTQDDLRASLAEIVLANRFAERYVVTGVTDPQARLTKLNKWQTDLVQTGKVDRLKGPTSGTAPRVGTEAPDFVLKDINGKEVRLSSLRGRPVVLNVWAPWCPPCRAEMPNLQAVYKSRGAGSSGGGGSGASGGSSGFELLAVATQSDQSNVAAFVKEFNATFPVFLDTQNEVTDLYQVGPIPTSYFIDKDGVIRAVQIGQMDEATLNQHLDNTAGGH